MIVNNPCEKTTSSTPDNNSETQVKKSNQHLSVPKRSSPRKNSPQKKVDPLPSRFLES